MRRGPRQYPTSSDLRPARSSAEVHSGHSALFGPVLRTKYPCCGGRCRIATVSDIPRERYERVCGHCGTKWTVERSLISDAAGVRLDKLEWETPLVEIHARSRRALLEG